MHVTEHWHLQSSGFFFFEVRNKWWHRLCKSAGLFDFVFEKDYIYKLQRARDRTSSEFEFFRRESDEMSMESRLLLLFVSDFLPYEVCRECFAHSLQRTRRNDVFIFHRVENDTTRLSPRLQLLLWLLLGFVYTGMVIFVFVYGSMATSAHAQQTALGAFLLWIFADALIVKTISVFLKHVCVQSLLSGYVRGALRYVEQHIHDYSAMPGDGSPSGDKDLNSCQYFFVSHQTIQLIKEEHEGSALKLNSVMNLITAFQSSVASYDVHPINTVPILSNILATSGVALMSMTSLWCRYLPTFAHDCVVETAAVLLTFCIVLLHLLLFEQSPVFAFIPLLIVLSLLTILVYFHFKNNRPRQYSDSTKLVIAEPADSERPLFSDERHLALIEYQEKRNAERLEFANMSIVCYIRRTVNAMQCRSHRKVVVQDHVVSEFSQILHPHSSITAIEFDVEGNVQKSEEGGTSKEDNDANTNTIKPSLSVEVDVSAEEKEKDDRNAGIGVQVGPSKAYLSTGIDDSKDEIFAGQSLYSASSRFSAKSASSSATWDDISVLKDLDFWKMKRKQVEIKATKKNKRKHRGKDRKESNHVLSTPSSDRRTTKLSKGTIPEYYEMVEDKPPANSVAKTDGKLKLSLADLFSSMDGGREETEAAYMDINWDEHEDGFDIEHWQK